MTPKYAEILFFVQIYLSPTYRKKTAPTFKKTLFFVIFFKVCGRNILYYLHSNLLSLILPFFVHHAHSNITNNHGNGWSDNKLD